MKPTKSVTSTGRLDNLVDEVAPIARKWFLEFAESESGRVKFLVTLALVVDAMCAITPESEGGTEFAASARQYVAKWVARRETARSS